MLSRIAIVSNQGFGLEAVHAALRNPLKFTVREFVTMDSVNQGLRQFPMDLLIVRLSRFERQHVQIAEAARRRFPRVGLVIMAKAVEPSARASVSGLARLRLLEEPVETVDLTAVVEKILKGESSSARLHPRIRRSDELKLVDSTGLVHRGRFLDFAQMGARIEFESLVRFKPRDSVQVAYVSSNGTEKSHRIEAKVVWSEISGGFMEQIMGVKQQTVGLRFIAAY